MDVLEFLEHSALGRHCEYRSSQFLFDARPHMKPRRNSGSMTPPNSRTPSYSRTPPFGSGTQASVVVSRASLALLLMLAFAVAQGVFFLLPVAPAYSRLLGVALALAMLLISRRMTDSAQPRLIVASLISLGIAANFIVHLYIAAPNFPFRIIQLVILFSYVALLLAWLTVLVARVAFPHAITAWAVAGLVMITAESILGGPEDFSAATGRVAWVGPVVYDSIFGTRFTPGSTVKSLYPDNPRGYFDEPDVLQRRWSLFTFEGSAAKIEFPADKPDVLRVNITQAVGGEPWHIWIGQAPLRVNLNEQYEVRFRARADSVRNLIVGVGQAHDPYVSIGLYREVRLDTAWQAFHQTFRATDSDRNARLYFDLGTDVPSVELSTISIRALSTDKFVESPSPHERSISYRLNHWGCRAGDYNQKTDSLGWRILSVGSGSTFGVGVHQGDTYSARLEGLLNDAQPGSSSALRFEVINCGFRDLTPTEVPRVINALAEHYVPDLVLLSVGPDDRSLRRGNDAPVNQDLKASPFSGLFHIGQLFQSRDDSESFTPDIASTVRMIRLADEAAHGRGARLAVIVFQNQQGQYWTSLDSALTNNDLSEIPILDVGPVLLPFGEPALLVHSQLDWHPNELAHRLAADALKKFLSERGLLGAVVGTTVESPSVIGDSRRP